MNTLFILLFLVSLIGLIVGLIKPSWVRMPSRKRAAIVFGVATVFSFILIGLTVSKTTEPLPSPVVANTITIQSSPTPPTSISAGPTKEVVALLTKTTNDYATLFANAKSTLGTTQYADGFAGMQALNDPNSAAARFGVFDTNTCVKNDSGAAAMTAYRNASDLYYAANMQEPDGLATWRDDMGQLASDICTWASHGVSWQVKGIPTSTLQADEQKIAVDLTSVRADITALSK